MSSEPRSDVPAAPVVESAAGGGLRLPVAAWAALWTVGWTGAAVACGLALRGTVSWIYVILAAFLAINLMICVWEMCLLLRIDAIEARFARRRTGSGKGRRSRSFFLSSVALRDLGSADLWSRVWSEYATYDPSYADRRSFGFAIDVGNGFSTWVPSLVFGVGMVAPILPPVVLGIVGLLVFYQKFYGTLLYFFTYVFNRRYEGRPLASVLAFVGGVNGIWLVGPGIGLYACVRLVLENDMAVLWR